MWHGSPLSLWEHLSLASFVRLGHQVELYTYQEMTVPRGVALKDANLILSQDEIFKYADGPAKGSSMAFSNLFRLLLLSEKGGIWCDLDMLCLKSLDALPDSACAGLTFRHGINGAFLRFPEGSLICKKILNEIESLGQSLALGQTSEILTTILGPCSSENTIMSPSTFYPFEWDEAWKLVDPKMYDECETKTADTYCVHWWSSAMKSVMGFPDFMLPPEGSYLHQKAILILGDNYPVVPVESAKVWIEHFKAAALNARQRYRYRPLSALLKSDKSIIVEDIKCILGSLARRFSLRAFQ